MCLSKLQQTGGCIHVQCTCKSCFLYVSAHTTIAANVTYSLSSHPLCDLKLYYTHCISCNNTHVELPEPVFPVRSMWLHSCSHAYKNSIQSHGTDQQVYTYIHTCTMYTCTIYYPDIIISLVPRPTRSSLELSWEWRLRYMYIVCSNHIGTNFCPLQHVSKPHFCKVCALLHSSCAGG